MSAITQPLRDEHQDLLPHIEALARVADLVGEAPTDVLHKKVDGVYDFLARHLIPHAEAEERALYPVVARILGAPEATRTMSRDHAEVRRLTDELRDLRARLGEGANGAQLKALRRVLYGLYALVKVHFEKEEDVYLPILDARLSPQDAVAMFEAMEAAADEAKAHAAAR